MGLSEQAPGLFVVGEDSIVVFRDDESGLHYVTHCSTRERLDPYETPPQVDEGSEVTVISIPGKGACGIGVLGGGGYIIAWHTGPHHAADPTTIRWLRTIQKAQGESRESTTQRIRNLAAWCPPADDQSDRISAAVIAAIQSDDRLFVYFEERAVLKGYRTFDPRRFRQRPSPYEGKVLQPWLVRYSDPQPHDSLDVFINPRGRKLTWPAELVWVRAILTGMHVDTPVDPRAPGARWYEIDLLRLQGSYEKT